MSKGEDRHSYVERVRSDTKRYLEELLSEVESLRSSLALAESEKRQLHRDKLEAQERGLELREKLVETQEELSTLRLRLAEAETRSHVDSERHQEVERQNNDLANLYVASYRLHETAEREEVIAAIHEILINLVGCEEFVIFELERGGSELARISAFGVDSGHLERVSCGTGIIGGVAQSGEPYFAGRSEPTASRPEEDELTACLPLRMETGVRGVIALFRLLPQKEQGLEDLDFELFDLLASQAGTALYLSSLHAQYADSPTGEEMVS